MTNTNKNNEFCTMPSSATMMDDRPILVGYAFGPKKMKTMTLVMAEASMEVSTVATHMPPRTLKMNHQPKLVEEYYAKQTYLDDDDSMSTCTVTTCSTDTDSDTDSIITSTSSSMPQHYQPMRVNFVPLDLNSPLEEQHGGKFDAILHKMTEDILCKSQMHHEHQKRNHNQLADYNNTNTNNISHTREQQEALNRIEKLIKYKQDHPACCVVDDPNNVQSVMSRSDIAYTLENCLRNVTSKSGIKVSTPRFLVLNHNSEQQAKSSTIGQIAKEIDDASLNYPFIVKPLIAAGTAQSHNMGILLSRHGIPKIHTPCLLQEYLNHDERLYKVYVLGDKVWVFPRQSLPNLPMGDFTSSSLPTGMKHDYVEFDSQKPYPSLTDFGVDKNSNMIDALSTSAVAATTTISTSTSTLDSINHTSSQTEIGDENDALHERLLAGEEVRPVADCIRHAFGLELFGFDILVTEKLNGEKEMLVVDVNYFPSYKELSNFPQLLAQYLAQCGIEGRIRSYNSEQ